MAGYIATSKAIDWETPDEIFEKISDLLFVLEGGKFLLDACASPQNAKLPFSYSPEEDGLSQPWLRWTWCNPPYGKEISAWIEKATEQQKLRKYSVLLLPNCTDTRWFHRLTFPHATRIFFVEGRIKFKHQEIRSTSNVKGSLVVFFGDRYKNPGSPICRSLSFS